MKLTDFYLLEIIAQITYILIIASVIFFILAVVSEKNSKLLSAIGGVTGISCVVLFIYSILVGIA
ncbi:MAG: hypothetical protein ACTSO9_04330 [Candidatus Helarchaeota archaeon]